MYGVVEYVAVRLQAIQNAGFYYRWERGAWRRYRGETFSDLRAAKASPRVEAYQITVERVGCYLCPHYAGPLTPLDNVVGPRWQPRAIDPISLGEEFP